MQFFDYYMIFKGEKGLITRDVYGLYFLDKSCKDVKVGLISVDTLSRDFRQEKGYCFIKAHNIETQHITASDLIGIVVDYGAVIRGSLGSTEFVVASNSYSDSDISFNTSLVGSFLSNGFHIFVKIDDKMTKICSCVSKYDKSLRFFQEQLIPLCRCLSVEETLEVLRGSFSFKSDEQFLEACMRLTGLHFSLNSEVKLGVDRNLGILYREEYLSYTNYTIKEYYVYADAKLKRLGVFDGFDRYLNLEPIDLSKVKTKMLELGICTTTGMASGIEYLVCNVVEFNNTPVLVYAFRMEDFTFERYNSDEFKPLRKLVESTTQAYNTTIKKYQKYWTPASLSEHSLRRLYFY